MRMKTIITEDEAADAVVEYNGEIVICSLDLAYFFGRKHKDIISKIEKVLTWECCLQQERWCYKVEYKDNKGKQKYYYLMTWQIVSGIASMFRGGFNMRYSFLNILNTMLDADRDRNREISSILN